MKCVEIQLCFLLWNITYQIVRMTEENSKQGSKEEWKEGKKQAKKEGMTYLKVCWDFSRCDSLHYRLHEKNDGN